MSIKRKSLVVRKYWLFVPCLILLLLLGCSQPAAPATDKPAAGGAVATAAPGSAATSIAPKKRTNAEIGMLDLNPARQQILEEGAKAEGELMLYTSSTGMEPVAAAFMKRYPFIKMEVYQSGADITQRIQAEIAANRLGGDVFNGGVRFFHSMASNFILFKSPVANFSIEPNGALNHISLIVFGYNTKLVAPGDVPQTVDDLARPMFKGKIGFHNPPNTYAGMWTGTVIQTMGEEKARALLTQLGNQGLFLYTSGNVGIQAVQSGEILIASQSQSSVEAAKKTGAPIDWVALDPTFASVNVSGIFEKAAHPYSALLFEDFLLSPEGEKISQEQGGYLSMAEINQKMAFGHKLPARIHLESPSDQENLTKWGQLFTELAAKKK